MNIVCEAEIPKRIQAEPFIYCPSDFDPSRYGGAIARHPDAARWMLSTVYLRRLLRNYPKDSYVNLHSGLLGLVMGDMAHVRPVRKALADHGLIECDGEYGLGTKSFGYRLGPVTKDADWRKFTSTNKRFLK